MEKVAGGRKYYLLVLLLVFSLLIVSCSPQQETVAGKAIDYSSVYSPVKQWTFETGGDSYTLKESGSAEILLPGISEKGLALDGNQYVQSSSSVINNQRFTVVGWINPQNNLRGGIFRSATYYNAEFRSNGAARLNVAGATSSQCAINSPDLLPLNQWYFVAIRKNNDNHDLIIIDEINGNVHRCVASAEVSGNGGAINIGICNGCTNRFNGIIDEFAIFNYNLMDAQIEELFNLGLPLVEDIDGDGILDNDDVQTCGNNLLEAPRSGQGWGFDESCDGGACCNADCTFMMAGVECHASAGVCDIAESCTGTSADCPIDEFQPTTTVCRISSTGDACDTAEYCGGSSVNCPGDDIVICLEGECIAGVCESNPPILALGDVNGDEATDSADVISIVRHILGIITLGEDVLSRADVDCNNRVSLHDAIELLNFITRNEVPVC